MRAHYERAPKRRCDKGHLDSITVLVRRWGAAVAEWIAAGCPRRDKAEELRIVETCKACIHYQDNYCTKCQCQIESSVTVKSAAKMATKHCPLNPPKW
jgi:hypothetical protein